MNYLQMFLYWVPSSVCMCNNKYKNCSPESEGLADMSKCKNSEQGFHKRVKDDEAVTY